MRANNFKNKTKIQTENQPSLTVDYQGYQSSNCTDN